MDGVTRAGWRSWWRTGAVAAAAALVGSAATGFAAVGFAGDEGGGGSPTPAGEPYVDEVEGGVGSDAPMDRSITTGSFTYDPAILTKFIAGAEFDAQDGDGIDGDLVVNGSGTHSCVHPDPDGGGDYAEVYAGLELPDGARIHRLVAYGRDAHSTRNIVISLAQTRLHVSVFGGVTRFNDQLVSFDTSAASGNFSIASPANLNIVTGSTNTPTGVDHRFYSFHVQMWNAASGNHSLCGVEVRYQVPTRAAGDGATYFPIDPVRAYDGRIGSYISSGILAPNTSKVISIKDGHDDRGVVDLEDAVPAGATAVTYNATVAGPTGPNFVAITPGDSIGFTASAVNFDGTTDVANAGTVTVDTSRQIKIWAGNQAGSTYVIIDITGYFLPANHPNMGN